MERDPDLRELWKRLRDLESSLGELSTKTALLNQAFARIEDLENRVRFIENNMSDRIHRMELDIANNKMLFNMVRWLAVTMAGSAITVLISTFLD